jgi:hypothetical protein
METKNTRSLNEMYADLGMMTYNITVYESALQALKEQKQELMNQIHSLNSQKSQEPNGTDKTSSTDMGTTASIN